jgi:hypothetical protein
MYVRQVKSWIEVFNQSKNYKNTIYCPRYHVFSHGNVRKVVEDSLASLFGLKYLGSYEMNDVEYYTWADTSVNMSVEKFKIPDHEPNVDLLTDIVRKNLVMPKPETKPDDFGLRPCSHSQYLIGRVCSEETLIKSLMDYINVFNSSKNYNNVIYCPKYHRFAHSKFSSKVFENIMDSVFGLKYIGSYTDSPKRLRSDDFDDGHDVKFFAWKSSVEVIAIQCSKFPE